MGTGPSLSDLPSAHRPGSRPVNLWDRPIDERQLIGPPRNKELVKCSKTYLVSRVPATELVPSVRGPEIGGGLMPDRCGQRWVGHIFQ